MRKLASIQRVVALEPIEGADRIEKCVVLGWEVVVQKGKFRVGDLCLFVEVDSVLPEKPEYEFLRERKFRVRCIRLKKQVSQGLVFPLSEIPELAGKRLFEGDDVTELLGIVKHDPEAARERVATQRPTKGINPLRKLLLRFAWYRYIDRKIFKTERKGWPGFITKTDEERLQNMPGVLRRCADDLFYASEKLDGCVRGDTLLLTPSGPRSISELCETSYCGRVWGFDEFSGVGAWGNVLGRLNRPHVPETDWFEIELEDGTRLTLTGSHPVYLPDLGLYQTVDHLCAGDVVLTQHAAPPRGEA